MKVLALKLSLGWVSRRCFSSQGRPQGPQEVLSFKEWLESCCPALPPTSMLWLPSALEEGEEGCSCTYCSAAQHRAYKNTWVPITEPWLLVLQCCQLFFTYHHAFRWVMGCWNRCFVGTMDAPWHWQRIWIDLTSLGYFPQKLTKTFIKLETFYVKLNANRTT